MIGGVTVNLILGIVIMITLTYSQGEKYVPQSMVNEQGGIYAGPVARSVGFQIGDQILSINGVAVDNLDAQFGDPSFLTADRKEIGIRRKQISPITYTKAGDTETAQVTQIVYDTTLVMPNNFDELLGAKSDMPLFAPRMKFKIGKVMGGSHAEKAGLDVGDKIEYINGEPVFSFFEREAMLLAWFSICFLSVFILLPSLLFFR